MEEAEFYREGPELKHMSDDEYAERQAAVENKLNNLEQQWNQSNLPPVEGIYRMNDSEFMHHVHQLAHTAILKEYLGITDEQMEVLMKEAFAKEIENWMPVVIKMRREAIRASLVPQPGQRPNGPGIIKP